MRNRFWILLRNKSLTFWGHYKKHRHQGETLCSLPPLYSMTKNVGIERICFWPPLYLSFLSLLMQLFSGIRGAGGIWCCVFYPLLPPLNADKIRRHQGETMCSLPPLYSMTKYVGIERICFWPPLYLTFLSLLMQLFSGIRGLGGFDVVRGESPLSPPTSP